RRRPSTRPTSDTRPSLAGRNRMIIDCHVHISACTPGRGVMSQKLMKSFAFKFMQWRFGIHGASAETEATLEQKLVETINETTELDAVALLAFDAVYTKDGILDADNTHLYVTNDYVIELAARHEKILFAASVHPYRRDAIEQLERCV